MGAATCRIRAHARNKGAQGQLLPLSRPPHLIICWIWRFMVTKNRMNLGGSKGRPRPAREPQALAGVDRVQLVGRSAARLGGRECSPVEHEDGPVHGEVEQGDQGGHRPKQNRLGAVPPAEQEHDTARRRSSACSSAQSSGPWPACPVHRQGSSLAAAKSMHAWWAGCAAPCRPAPELELWQASHEWAELFVRFARQGWALKLRVDLWAAVSGQNNAQQGEL